MPIIAKRKLYSNVAAYAPAVVIPSYTGPGDIVGSALCWWGLRAYSSASIGSNVIRLKESGGGTELDFPTIAGGGLNLADIATFKGANNLTVVTLYDQTGNGRTMTAGVQPTFTLAGLGSLPVMGFTSGSANGMTLASITQSQPTTISTVLKMTNNGSVSAQNIMCLGGANIQQIYSDADNTLNMYAGGTPGVTAAGGVWHAVQFIFNGASSNIVVDASPNTVNSGIDGINGTTLFGARGGQNPTMSWVEGGLWGSAFNSTQYANMDANQSAYWGV